MGTITLSNGMEFEASEEDIEALVEAGMIEVVERDEQGRITKGRITEAARNYVKEMESEEKRKWN